MLARLLAITRAVRKITCFRECAKGGDISINAGEALKEESGSERINGHRVGRYGLSIENESRLKSLKLRMIPIRDGRSIQFL